MYFDQFGNLTPYERIDLTLQQAENEFVTSFAPQNDVRKRLWLNLAVYNSRLRILFNVGWAQWIGGSFVTAKPAPGDLDLVNLIEYSDLLNERLSENFSEGEFLFCMNAGQKSGSWHELKIDGYLIPVYPETHPSHKRYQKELAYWTKVFGQEENSDRTKGFISLKYD